MDLKLKKQRQNLCFFVRMKGLEPPRLAAPDPKSGAATNYATSALRGANIHYFVNLYNILCPFFCFKMLTNSINLSLFRFKNCKLVLLIFLFIVH